MIKFLIFIVFVVIVIRLSVVFRDRIRFFATGSDKGFSLSEIVSLWKLAKISGLDDPERLFYSLPLMSRAIIKFLSDIRDAGTEGDKSNQDFLSKLYAYRTKISLDHESHRGLDSTKYLDNGQKLRILLPGSGVFQSEIMDNAGTIIIRVPSKKGLFPISGSDWIGKKISVYLWRKGDAAYVFDSSVESSDVYRGASVLHITHSSEMLRMQKRKSIRAKCEISAQLYFFDETDVDYDIVETEPGFRCILEDVSEDGALIRVGGKGVKDANIKIQYEINGTLVIMFGVVKSVEYNKSINQSRLHFECLHLDDQMKNNVLSFVYNLLPEEKKEELDAIVQTESDANSSEQPNEDVGFSDVASDDSSNVSADEGIRDLPEDDSMVASDTSANSDDGEFSEHVDASVNEFREKMDAFKRS